MEVLQQHHTTTNDMLAATSTTIQQNRQNLSSWLNRPDTFKHGNDQSYISKRYEKKMKLKLDELPVLSKVAFLASFSSLDQFHIKSVLGRGSFGVVHEAEIYGQKVALKLIHRTQDSDSEHTHQLKKSFKAEQNLRGLKHKNLVQFLGCNDDDDNDDNDNDKNVVESPYSSSQKFIVYEYGGRMNLNQLIMDGKIDINFYRRKRFSLDLINALEYIHANNIIHMDLKPSNIIVTDSLVCKLSDFGCSIKLVKQAQQQQQQLDMENNNCPSSINLNIKYESSSSSLSAAAATTASSSSYYNKQTTEHSFVDSRWTAGTWFYRAPELFKKDMSSSSSSSSSSSNKSSFSSVSTACDIYSLGICMWQLLTRDSPFSGENPHVIIYQIVSNHLRPQYPPSQLEEEEEEEDSSSSNGNGESELEQMNGVSLGGSNDSHKSKLIEFERNYRLIVENCWKANASERFSAKRIKELLVSSLISS